jgi:hypothetical protein
MPMTPDKINENLAMLQYAYRKKLAPNPITVDTELKALTEKQGREDYVDDQAFRESEEQDTTYSTNTARILDYLILHFSVVVAEIVNKYEGSPVKAAANVPFEVNAKMKAYVSPALDYLDDSKGVIHVTSMQVYSKTAYLTWFLESMIQWSKSQDEAGKIFKLVIEKGVGIYIKPLQKRLSEFETKYKLQVHYSYANVEKEVQLLKANGAEVVSATPAQPNGQSFFASQALTRPAANSTLPPEEEKKGHRLQG